MAANECKIPHCIAVAFAQVKHHKMLSQPFVCVLCFHLLCCGVVWCRVVVVVVCYAWQGYPVLHHVCGSLWRGKVLQWLVVGCVSSRSLVNAAPTWHSLALEWSGVECHRHARTTKIVFPFHSIPLPCLPVVRSMCRKPLSSIPNGTIATSKLRAESCLQLAQVRFANERMNE